MEVSRRRFVQLIGAAVAAIKVPIPAVADSLPRLVGDGIHNDAPAINAMLSRQPIEIGPLIDVTGAGWNGNIFRFPSGKFRMGEPLRIVGGGGTEKVKVLLPVANIRFKRDTGGEGSPWNGNGR